MTQITLGNGRTVNRYDHVDPKGGFVYGPDTSATQHITNSNYRYERTIAAEARRQRRMGMVVERLYQENPRGVEQIVERIFRDMFPEHNFNGEFVPSIPSNSSQCLIARVLERNGFGDPNIGYGEWAFYDENGTHHTFNEKSHPFAAMVMAIPKLYDDGKINGRLVDPQYRMYVALENDGLYLGDFDADSDYSDLYEKRFSVPYMDPYADTRPA